MSMSRVGVCCVSAALLIGGGGGVAVGATQDYERYAPIAGEIVSYLQQYYYKELTIDPQHPADLAAVFAQVDESTMLLPPVEHQQLETEMSVRLFGIGVEFAPDPALGVLVITRIYPGRRRNEPDSSREITSRRLMDKERSG